MFVGIVYTRSYTDKCYVYQIQQRHTLTQSTV